MCAAVLCVFGSPSAACKAGSGVSMAAQALSAVVDKIRPLVFSSSSRLLVYLQIMATLYRHGIEQILWRGNKLERIATAWLSLVWRLKQSLQ